MLQGQVADVVLHFVQQMEAEHPLAVVTQQVLPISGLSRVAQDDNAEVHA